MHRRPASASPPSPRRGPHRGPVRVATLSLAAATLACGIGCTGSLNQSTGVRGADLPDLDPDRSIASLVVVEADPDTEWTPRDPGRETWPVVVVAVPRGQVEVNPTPFFRDRLMPGRDAPSRSLPTPEQAVSVVTDDGRVTRSAMLDPIRSAWSLVESPVGLVIRPPWQVLIQPTRPVEMLPPRGDAPVGLRRLDSEAPDRIERLDETEGLDGIESP
jgi:hypothetical protein